MNRQLELVPWMPGETPAPEVAKEEVSSYGERLDRFFAFERTNPSVYVEIFSRARTLLGAGVPRFGTQLLVEAVRFDYAIRTQGEPFKINNDFVALWARRLIADLPSLASRIEIRESAIFAELKTRPDRPAWVDRFDLAVAEGRRP